jgi:hypothetical protein
MGGLTFKFTLDYANRLVTVQFSVCSDEDNFSKEIGRTYADKSEEYKYNLDKFMKLADMHRGFSSAALSVLLSKWLESNDRTNTKLHHLLKYYNVY